MRHLLEIEVEDVFAPEEYINHEIREKEENDRANHDYAILILKKSTGTESGYFGLHAVAANHALILEEKEIYARGYPEVKMKEENSVRFEQREEMGRIIEFGGKKGLFYHTCSSSPGLDGSAVYYKQKDSNKSYVIGVQVGEYKDYIKACWITNEKWQKIYD